jgi:glycosyltransferase involved in cell wall biosynthesis
VSVIIPAYNAERYIEDALKSVFDQTFSGIEIIVVDDGSHDGTAGIAKNYEASIRYIHQENKGLAAARNTGIRSSSGSYLAFLDADDLFLPEKIELQSSFLDEHPEIGMVFSGFEYLGGSVLRHPVPESIRSGQGDIVLDLFRFNCIAIPTVLVRRECFDEVGLFDETLKAVEDYDLWLRLSRKKRIAYLDRILARVRLHPDNMSKDAELMCDYEIRVMEKALNDDPGIRAHHPALIREKVCAIYFESGYRLLLADEMRRARQKFLCVVKSDPFKLKPYIYLVSSFLGSGFLKAARKTKRFFQRKGGGIFFCGIL